MKHKIHQERNPKLFCKMLAIKQEVLAFDLDSGEVIKALNTFN